jgi:hypothetical protein
VLTVPVTAIAFPAFWLFLLGFILAMGVLRLRRERHDVRDDWNRLVRMSQSLKVVESTRGRDEPARLELIALARALDLTVAPPEGHPGLTAQAGGFDPGERPSGLGGDAVIARAEVLRRDLLAVDRTLQDRMKAGERAAGHVGRAFLAGLVAILLLPLEAGRKLGWVERLTARRVEASLWFQGALGVLLFIVLAGTAYSGLHVVRIATRLGEDLGLWP